LIDGSISGPAAPDPFCGHQEAVGAEHVVVLLPDDDVIVALAAGWPRPARTSAQADTSKAKMLRSNIVSPTANLIDCQHWRLILSI
jgi:hypothetical protein